MFFGSRKDFVFIDLEVQQCRYSALSVLVLIYCSRPTLAGLFLQPLPVQPSVHNSHDAKQRCIDPQSVVEF